MKKPFVVTQYFDTELEEYQKVIFVDEEMFDWGIEEEALQEAKKFAAGDYAIKKAIHGDIKKFFLDSLSEFLGRTITLKEVNEAVENGYI